MRQLVLDSYFINNFSFISFKLAVITHLTVLAINNITDGRTKKWDQKEYVLFPLYDVATQVKRNRMTHEMEYKLGTARKN